MSTKNPCLWIVALLTCTAVASAEVKTKEVDYAQGETQLQGYLAWDDALPGKRPGVPVSYTHLTLPTNREV